MVSNSRKKELKELVELKKEYNELQSKLQERYEQRLEPEKAHALVSWLSNLQKEDGKRWLDSFGFLWKDEEAFGWLCDIYTTKARIERMEKTLGVKEIREYINSCLS